MKILCGKCKGRGRLGTIVCPICRGTRYLLVFEPRADAERSDPMQRDLRAMPMVTAGWEQCTLHLGV